MAKRLLSSKTFQHKKNLETFKNFNVFQTSYRIVSNLAKNLNVLRFSYLRIYASKTTLYPLKSLEPPDLWKIPSEHNNKKRKSSVDSLSVKFLYLGRTWNKIR